MRLYHALIRSCMEYGGFLMHNISQDLSAKLDKLQMRALRVWDTGTSSFLTSSWRRQENLLFSIELSIWVLIILLAWILHQHTDLNHWLLIWTILIINNLHHRLELFWLLHTRNSYLMPIGSRSERSPHVIRTALTLSFSTRR